MLSRDKRFRVCGKNKRHAQNRVLRNRARSEGDGFGESIILHLYFILPTIRVAG